MPIEFVTVVGNLFGSGVILEQRLHSRRQLIKVPSGRDDDVLIRRLGVAVEEVVEVLKILHLMRLWKQIHERGSGWKR